MYLDWKNNGQVDRIVFSGWVDDLPEHSEILNQIVFGGGEVTLTYHPPVYSTGHILHQQKSLYYGLSLFHDNDRIIRLRTDKIPERFDIDHISRMLDMRHSTGENSPFKERIVIANTLTHQPFFFFDRMFAGNAEDLGRLCHFSIWHEMKHCFLNPEQILFFETFRSLSPFSALFFELNPGISFDSTTDFDNIYSNMVETELYQIALAESYRCLESSFMLGMFGNAASQRQEYRSLEEALLDRTTSMPDEIQLGQVFPIIDSDHFITSLLDSPVNNKSAMTLRGKLQASSAKSLPYCRAEFIEKIWNGGFDSRNPYRGQWNHEHFNIFGPRVPLIR